MSDFYCGTHVAFRDDNGEERQGVVTKITKTPFGPLYLVMSPMAYINGSEYFVFYGDRLKESAPVSRGGKERPS